MEDERKTKKQLIAELNALHQAAAELKSFEEEIKQTRVTQEKFTKAFRNNSIPMTITTVTDGRFVDVSDAFLKLVELKRDEVVGHTSRETGFITEEQRSVFYNGLSKSGRIENLEMQIMSKGRGLRYGLFNVVLMSINNENYLLTTIQDVTDWKQSEEILRDSENKLQAIFDTVGTGILIVDKDTQIIIEANSTAIAMTGFPKEKIIGKICHSLVCPAQAGKCPVKDLGQSVDQSERKLLCAKGHQKDILKTVHPITLKGRDYYVESFIDISERKQVKEALKQIHKNYETYFNTINEFLFVLDEQGNIIHTNTTVIDRLGYTREELIGKSVLMVHPPERRDEAGKIVGEMLSGVAEFCPVPVITKSGAQIPVETRVSHGFWDGKPVIFGVTKDVSQVRLSEEKFSKLFHLNPSACGLSGLDDHKYIEVNEAFYALLGFDKNEVIGKTANDLGILTTEAISAALLKADSNGNVTNAEANLKAKNGDMKHVLLSSENIIVQDKKYRFTVVHDITERRQTEEKLRESEQFLRETQSIALMGGWKANPETDFLQWTEGVYRMLEIPLDYHPGLKEGMTYYTPETTEILRGKILNTLATNEPFVEDCEVVTTSGKKLWAEVRGLAHVMDGQTPCVMGTIQDITERKRAEAVRQEQENKLSSIFRAAPVGIGMVINRVFQECNDTLCLMTGYSRDELMGINAQMLYPTLEDYEYVGQEKYSQISKNGIGTVETHWKRKDGKIIDIILSSTPLDPDDLAKGVTFTALDITARKQAEEEKRILEDRLQHADKMDAIGTLAGGVAHDFNNLLMGIQGNASLSLMDIDPTHPTYENLKRIEEQVQSGAALTKQLLGFARGGKYEVKPTDMNEVIEKISSLFGRTKKEISIQRKHGKDLWSVEVDRGQMEQVFLNLYVNAWQAMPGGGDIYLETQNILLDEAIAISCSAKPGKYVKITVTDSGTGMDEKTKARIFEPFFTTKRMGRGTGLGLATVYGIIKGHHGIINVYSEPGHGTTFTVYLPASEKEVVKEKTATGKIIRGKETILLVDDEKMVMEVSKELLESLGYKVYVAGSGQEAIAVYMEKGNKIDLVILDMIMPGISGGGTFDRLMEINPQIKILLSSGYSLNGQAQEILDRGCKGFLQKPFHLSQFSGKIREILD